MKHKLVKLWAEINRISSRYPDIRRDEGAEARQVAKRARYASDPSRGAHAREIARAQRREDRSLKKAVKRYGWGWWKHLNIPVDQS